MGLEDILLDIEEEAREKESAFLNEAKEERNKILAQGKAEAERVSGQILQQAGQEAENLGGRILTAVRLEAHQSALKAKQDLIKKVYEKVLEKIQTLPRQEYAKLMERLLVESVAAGSGSKAELLAAEKDKNIFDKQFTDRVNNQLKKKNARVVISKNYAPISGGFILKLGKSEIDNSLPTLLRGWREDTQAEVVKILFQNKLVRS